MLAYNVDLLLLPPDSGLQTQFYCTFAFKSRMAIGGYDYYLLPTTHYPLLAAYY
jgi:hypothetical protein